VDGCLRGQPCPACGHPSVVRSRPALTPGLIQAWELSPEWVARFEHREGTYCPVCGNNERARQLARVLVENLNRDYQLAARSLAELVTAPTLASLRLAEINSCGGLHRWLRQLPGLVYSEYGGTDGVRHEDLMNLTFADATFDLVLTSETLEHVPDVPRALAEIRRILRPGGQHVFTVPVICDRPRSRTCALLQGETLVHLRPPSYHGSPGQRAEDMMVMTEFGADLMETLARAGFEVGLEQDAANPALCTFITRKATP
jgi:SAM-dependent methyltransferase